MQQKYKEISFVLYLVALRIAKSSQDSPLDQIQRGGLACFLSSSKLHPSKTCSVPLSSSASPYQAFPPACAEIWQAMGPQGCREAITSGFWILDERAWQNWSSLSEGNTKKPDPNLTILSWQYNLASVTAIHAFRFLWHQQSLIVLIYLQKCRDQVWIY